MLVLDASEFGLKAEAVGRAAKQVPFVTAVALTNAIKDAREAERETMRSVFDRPTPYTLNALQVRPATKQRLQAELGFKEGFGGTPAWKYLGPQVAGGERKRKRFEIALTRAGILRSNEYCVPGRGAQLDGYGNMNRGQIVRILSALGAASDAAQNTIRRPKRSTRRRNLDYFVLRGTRAPDGVYLREGRAAVPILIFVKGTSYTKRFPYYEKGRTVVPVAYRKHFRAAWERFVVNDVRRKG
jgi:hypothetical protein